MKLKITILAVNVALCFAALQGMAQMRSRVSAKDELKRVFEHPPEDAKPWVFWYWMYGAVTKAGVTADLEAMHRAGIGGAYLMPIKSPGAEPLIPNPVLQLTPQWWDMVKYSMNEADRIGIKLAMHDCDGFALAGGPWITPELSMQKVVSVKSFVSGGKMFNDTLPTPAHYKSYYKDIRVVAYPSLAGEGTSSYDVHPRITTNLPETDVQYLGERGNKKSFATANQCWLQLAFDAPFTCRSLIIHTTASNYQSERLEIQVSNNGQDFKSLGRLTPPRHGWQDGDAQITNDIPEVKAKYFRFVYDKTGSEPGAEDLDFAKWKPSLKISGIELSAEPRIHQYESKTGEVWRISTATTTAQLPQQLCIPQGKIIDLTNKLSADGRLNWQVPAGQWTILRIGHTSTGHTNATGGAGNGLECDKFSEAAATLQFNSWFGEAFKHGGDALARRVLKMFHVDSWECGSQNWSGEFAAEFQKRRGYDLLPWLPVMAGVPVESAERSEKVLADVRETIAELVVDKFYGTMSKLAHAKGCTFSAEAIAPTMMSDGMLHYKMADIPMGEFWFRSPTHDKPNDMLDAISGGHIYGKNIIQAEGFTQLRLFWDEHPGMLKPLADRNLALGINRLVFHVGTHNPWLDRKPGMTLDGIGMFFQRDQTWWDTGKAWFEYITRCQALLQQGHPVVDIAVFTGEETPRRAVLPERLVSTLPGLFGEQAVKREAARMANVGEPIRNMASDASHSANIATADLFTDPLRGYAYDSMNLDALMTSTVENGRIILPGGASYGVLVIPGASAMDPNNTLSTVTINKLISLIKAGAHVIFKHDNEDPIGYPGYGAISEKMMDAAQSANKQLLIGGFLDSTLDVINIPRDCIVSENVRFATDVAWTHRAGDGFDIYFVSNQLAIERYLNLSLRTGNGAPRFFNAVTGKITQQQNWEQRNGRVQFPLTLPANGSMFIVLDQPTEQALFFELAESKPATITDIRNLTVQFDPKSGGPKQPVLFDHLYDWSKRAEDSVKYYSGTAVYTTTFTVNKKSDKDKSTRLDLGQVANLAQVYVNGKYCGTAWTAPYQVDVSNAIKHGINKLEIKVTNTWANRLMGDHNLPEKERITWTNAPYRLEGKELLPAGLFGPVQLIINAVKTD